MIQAYGTYVTIQRIENELEKKSKAIGLHLSQEAVGKKRDGASTLFVRGKILSVGHKACEHMGEDVSVGDMVLYNPFDEDIFEGVHIVPVAAIVGKIQ
jgi:co-chaperonin GroES (HSP10)